jgi:DNA-binding transcriptional LysR family regulator
MDVQLLLVFDALMTERHVTNAANALGLSQSAVSHALGRLRYRFADPLLVRTARGMEPTARALELVGPVRDVIRQVQGIFLSRPHFTPADSRDSFVIRISDANEILLLPAVLAALEKDAPGISVIVRHLSAADTLKALEDGTVDFAVSAFLSHSKSVRATSLFQDRMVCATSRGHPSVRRPLTLDAFLKLRHIRVVQHAEDVRFLDEELRARGLARNVVAVIPHWLVALHVVAGSGMAVSVSERAARHFDAERQLRLRAMPIGSNPFDWKMYWHLRHDAVPSQRWMRNLVAGVCANLAST